MPRSIDARWRRTRLRAYRRAARRGAARLAPRSGRDVGWALQRAPLGGLVVLRAGAGPREHHFLGQWAGNSTIALVPPGTRLTADDREAVDFWRCAELVADVVSLIEPDRLRTVNVTQARQLLGP